jgi:hypothetical protein
LTRSPKKDAFAPSHDICSEPLQSAMSGAAKQDGPGGHSDPDSASDHSDDHSEFDSDSESSTTVELDTATAVRGQFAIYLTVDRTSRRRLRRLLPDGNAPWDAWGGPHCTVGGFTSRYSRDKWVDEGEEGVGDPRSRVVRRLPTTLERSGVATGWRVTRGKSFVLLRFESALLDRARRLLKREFHWGNVKSGWHFTLGRARDARLTDVLAARLRRVIERAEGFEWVLVWREASTQKCFWDNATIPALVFGSDRKSDGEEDEEASGGV